jgi:hypothetical protein
VERDDRQVIHVRLLHPQEMFEMGNTDLFSEYRNFRSGIEFALSELRSHRDRRPIRLEIGLPASEIDDGLTGRMRRTLHRYCNHRMQYNGRERRATRFDGFSAFRVGLPIAALGLGLTVLATRVLAGNDVASLIEDHVGWVLAWIGLWFPLDLIFFYPLAYSRENRVLALLRDAEVHIAPYSVATVDSPA